MKNAVALTRAIAYKKKIDIDSKDVLENGAEQFQAMLYDAMADERPELYREIKKYLKEKSQNWYTHYKSSLSRNSMLWSLSKV